jgi:hypothetical protein
MVDHDAPSRNDVAAERKPSRDAVASDRDAAADPVPAGTFPKSRR